MYFPFPDKRPRKKSYPLKVSFLQSRKLIRIYFSLSLFTFRSFCYSLFLIHQGIARERDNKKYYI